MTIRKALTDPPLSGFVERIETHHIGQIAHAARDLALRAEIVFLHVVLNVEPVDDEAGSEVATREKHRPHYAVAGAARILRPAHRGIAFFLPAAARVVIEMLHDVRGVRL